MKARNVYPRERSQFKKDKKVIRQKNKAVSNMKQETQLNHEVCSEMLSAHLNL